MSKKPLVRKHGSIMTTMAGFVRGLPKGPYANRFTIARELEKFAEFRKPDGSKYTRHYLEIITKKAEELGYVTCNGKQRSINHDSTITLTPVIDSSEPLVVRRRKVDKQDEETVTHTPQLEKPKEPLKPIDGLSMAILKTKLGFIESPKLMGTLNIINRLLPKAYWDDMAQNSIAKRLRKEGIEPVKMPEESFSRDEWFTLVWETLQSLPMSMVAPTFLEDLKFEDITAKCRDCQKDFVFAASEQQFFQRLYGEVRTPAMCKFCRKLKRVSESTR